MIKEADLKPGVKFEKVKLVYTLTLKRIMNNSNIAEDFKEYINDKYLDLSNIDDNARYDNRLKDILSRIQKVIITLKIMTYQS